MQIYRLAIFDHYLLCTDVFLEIWMWFTSTIVVFCKRNFWIFLHQTNTEANTVPAATTL